MRQRRNSRPSGQTAILMILMGGLTTLVFFSYALPGLGGRKRLSAEKYALAAVSRAELYPTIRTSGRVESSKRTVIECELENITIGIQGQRLSAGGAALLLSIVPEGTVVRRGDILAELDSSEYEELLRQQRITVERVRADHQQAKLNLEISQLAVREFEEGLRVETEKDFQRTLALAESDLQRVQDRLGWSRRMKEKGYVPAAQVTNDEFNHQRALFSLRQERGAFELFRKWTVPRTLMTLKGKVLAARATLNYEEARLSRQLERLEKLERQVELCTIRAPHDGLVIYANDARRDIQIEPGISVRQKQDLMYLPDLNDMEVVTQLHESVIKRVAPGMRAQVVVEGLRNRRLEGHLRSIAQLPISEWRSDVRFFEGIVKIDSVPERILPGMTAQVDLELDRRENVLVVPNEAVSYENGERVCYVAHDEGLERREVAIGEMTEDLVEITLGLEEGERVVLNPVQQEVEPDTIETTTLALSSPDWRSAFPGTAGGWSSEVVTQ